MKNEAFNIDSVAHPYGYVCPPPFPGVPLQVTPILYTSEETSSLLYYLSMSLDLKKPIIYSSRHPKPGDL